MTDRFEERIEIDITRYLRTRKALHLTTDEAEVLIAELHRKLDAPLGIHRDTIMAALWNWRRVHGPCKVASSEQVAVLIRQPEPSTYLRLVEVASQGLIVMDGDRNFRRWEPDDGDDARAESLAVARKALAILRAADQRQGGA